MYLETLTALEELYGSPTEKVRRKVIGHLDRHCRRMIELSPFLVLATARQNGSADVSPKGDSPGFVRVIDDHHMAIPDRSGNRRIDGLRNVIENPHVATLFFVPGIGDTLRVNGRARISVEPELLASMPDAKGTPAISALVIEVDEAFLHCPKAFQFSDLWGDSNRVERDSLPTLREMIEDQIASQES